MNKNGQAAAFYDLEGTLVSTNLVHTLAFYAKRQQGIWQTIKKSAARSQNFLFLVLPICIRATYLTGIFRVTQAFHRIGFGILRRAFEES